MVIALQAAIGGTITMLDQLAYMLTRAVISRNFRLCASLITIILKFMAAPLPKAVTYRTIYSLGA